VAIYDLQSKKNPKPSLKDVLLYLSPEAANGATNRARKNGHLARCYARTVKAGSTAVEIWVVVVRQKERSSTREETSTTSSP